MNQLETKYSNLSNEQKRAYILKDIRKNKLSKIKIAKKYGVSRNTVRNLEKKFSDITVDELKGCIAEIKNSDWKYIPFEFKKTRKRRVTSSEIKTIEQICISKLNCFDEGNFCPEFNKKLNFYEALEEYEKTSAFKNNNISYSTFYLYAREYINTLINDETVNILDNDG